MQHINNPAHDIRELDPTLDDAVADTIMRGLAIRPDERWRTARKMAEEFRTAAVRLGLPAGDLS